MIALSIRLANDIALPMHHVSIGLPSWRIHLLLILNHSAGR
jgi:hypothetical protein